MEPDHSATVANFVAAYPNAKIVGNAKTFAMIADFFDITIPEENKVAVANGESLSLGAHQLTFVFAPMVHWPEVMVTYDAKDKVLFSADGFGKFGALDIEEEWDCEARRYYIGIVGKYGAQVQALLKKAAALDIAIICPLHGPVLKDNLAHYINLYDIWSSYRAESEGVMIAYTSVYGHTKAAAQPLNDKLTELGFKCVKPVGAFYMFPQTPIEDDVAFCNAAKEYNLLLVPGSGFGCKGHMRLSYCVSHDTIVNSFPAFENYFFSYAVLPFFLSFHYFLHFIFSPFSLSIFFPLSFLPDYKQIYTFISGL